VERFNKKIGKSGSITLPAAMRRSLGIESGERFSISVNDEGSVVLKRVQGECVFCKSDSNLIIHEGRFVCSGCLKVMNAKCEGGNG
jgi:transcriptional pleiotropic regulator of transition state genes